MPRTPHRRLVALVALAGAIAAAPASADTLVTHTFTQTNDPNRPSDTITTPALKKGERYRLEVRGKVHYEAHNFFSSGTVPAMDCDAVYCIESDARSPVPERSGLVFIARPKTTRFYDLDVWVGEKNRIPYSPDHSYSETFRARDDGPLRIESVSAGDPSRPASGQIELTLSEAGEPELELDYEMEPRFEENDKGRLPSYDTPREISPDDYEVRLKINRRGSKTCNERLTYRFKIDGVKLAATRSGKNECHYIARVKREGRQKIEVRTRDGFGQALDGEERIVVQDFLIFGIGDSAGSGEGTGPNWANRRCHRSRHSQQVLAAQRIEDRDKRSSVTFVHVACSGGRIDTGLLGGYAGIEESSPDLPPQVDEVKRLAGTREIDAIEMSMGVNHLAFGALLGHCVSKELCMNEPFNGAPKASDFVDDAIASLPGVFAKLAPRLDAVLPPSSSERVFVTEYPELFRDEDGNRCDEVIAIPGYGGISVSEILFLELKGAIPLHNAVGAAAKAHGWTPITGIRSAFRKHGYCAKSSERWITTISGSLVNQLDKAGSMHPNREGYMRIAGYVTKRMAAALFPKNRPRPPREPERGIGLDDPLDDDD